MTTDDRPAPWFRLGRGWYVTITAAGARRQVPLGVTDPGDEKKALAALAALLAKLKTEAAPPVLVSDAVARFLARAESRSRPSTVAYYRRHLTFLAGAFGGRDVGTLRPVEVEEFALSRGGWSPRNRLGFLQTVEGCLRFAGATLTGPSGAVTPWACQKPRRRKSPLCLDEPTYWQLVGGTRGDFRAYLQALWHTGARPGEAARLTVELVDWSQDLAVLEEHKTSGQTDRPRVIHFNGPAMAVLRRQREKHGSGPLFRNEAGAGIDVYQAGRRLWRTCQRLGVKATLYSFRHSFCTRALAAGVSDSHVAELVGHASTETLHKNYSHLGEMRRALKDSLGKVA